MSEVLQGMEAPVVDRALVKALGSCKKGEREKAELQLRQLGPRAVDVLLAVLQQESVNRRIRRRNAAIAISVWVAIVIVLSAIGVSVAGSLGGMSGVFAGLFAASQLQRGATSVLAGYDDIRGVGRLAEALTFQDKKAVSEAEAALIRLLPRLNATDSGLLSEDQRKILCRALLKRKSYDLGVAILKAFEQIGGGDVVDSVQRAANGEARADGLRSTADEVLPVIRQRAENEQAARRLLRPSAAPDSPAEVLLRPAEGPGTSTESVLLRPVEGAPNDIAENATTVV